MHYKKILTTILVVGGCMTSCNDSFFELADDNHSNEARLLSDPAFAEGVLLNAYNSMPWNYLFEAAATDDAVSNVENSNYRRMATGEWSTIFDPVSAWSYAYRPIYYINHFLSINDKVDYAWDDRGSPSAEREAAFRKRFKGEAHALRAWFNFELLKRHGGIGADGNALGFVIVKEPFKQGDDFNLPRNSYEDCVAFILEDLEEAIALLPDIYANQGDNVVHNAVFGAVNKNRVNGQFAKALKSRVTLHVASMPFMRTAAQWEQAADAAAELLVDKGVAGLSSTGINFWRNENDPEILFRRDYSNANNREIANFPPSRYGQGQTNPSQNLVDAFPMSNGYPIGSGASGYDANNPYANRDPRLRAYILYNGNDLNGTVVNTTVADPLDGLNQTIASTRTGYYLKKLLHPAVNLTPTVMSTQRHFLTIFRYTEIYLNYAEAANEAWGPDADPRGYGFTAADIIAAIRQRAGIAQPDEYLNSIQTSQADMRELIRNERRIELCFEGFRFWDLRRWGLDLDQPVRGMAIEEGEHNVIEVENRNYEPFMQYGPVPHIEVLKGDRMIQNQGW